MAVRTHRLVSFDDESIVLSWDWDDVSGEVLLGRCLNTSQRHGVHVLVQGTGSGAAGRGFEQTFAAGSGLTEVGIPIGQRPAYPVVIGESGQPLLTGWNSRAETV